MINLKTGRGKQLHFEPLLGLFSPHAQTILPTLLPAGKTPPTEHLQVTTEDKDLLQCEVSTPKEWTKTVLLVHGLGGSHRSKYMIRMARKLYEKDIRVVRVNLRGSGSGTGLAKRPYNAGTSNDLLAVIQALDVPVTVIGFSLGGNIVLKLAGELGKRASQCVERFIAVSPPFDLEQTVTLLQQKKNSLYHHHYLRTITRQSTPWIKKRVRSLYEFDDLVTAPLWGYRDAKEYYERCSSKHFLPLIEQETRILLAKDDPFIQHDHLPLSSADVEIYRTTYGGHMGFLGRHTLYWLDELLLSWVEED